MVSWRGMKRGEWGMNSSTCHVHTPPCGKKKIKNIESIGPLTRYISPGYGAHGIMEGYEER